MVQVTKDSLTQPPLRRMLLFVTRFLLPRLVYLPQRSVLLRFSEILN